MTPIEDHVFNAILIFGKWRHHAEGVGGKPAPYLIYRPLQNQYGPVDKNVLKLYRVRK